MARDPIDPRIVIRARGGDPQAFEALLKFYQHRIHALAYRLTYNTELARDITQDIFLRLYERMDRYDPTRPFEPWFMSLATNYALNARQKAKLRKTLSIDQPVSPDSDRAIEPPDKEGVGAPKHAEDGEARSAIRQAVRELPDKYAGIVVLHYLEGLGVREIASRLDMPVGTVKIRLHRARNLLREKLRRFRSQ